jgi:glucose-6-phosphate isomerase
MIGFCRPLSPLIEQHDLLMANLFAQAEALGFSKTEEELKGKHAAWAAGSSVWVG